MTGRGRGGGRVAAPPAGSETRQEQSGHHAADEEETDAGGQEGATSGQREHVGHATRKGTTRGRTRASRYRTSHMASIRAFDA